MLYDPKWDQKPSLAGFVAWLRTKSPAEEYEWADMTGTCACDQYFKTLPGDRRELWGKQIAVVLDRLAIECPRTFGDLRKRAEAALDNAHS